MAVRKGIAGRWAPVMNTVPNGLDPIRNRG
jgi:hypothetical protein